MTKKERPLCLQAVPKDTDRLSLARTGAGKRKYELIRSRRKTMALQIKDGKVIVRAPYSLPLSAIASHEAWIEKHLKEAEKRESARQELPKFTQEELRIMKEKARQIIPLRVKYFAQQIGVTYGKITIRSQRSRWGSCSSKGNLNFNCLLMMAPMEVVDCIVVHELCHRKEMNHSPRFYREVLKFCPDYYERHKWLKIHGKQLIDRLPS